jgi:hypothetical protein
MIRRPVSWKRTWSRIAVRGQGQLRADAELGAWRWITVRQVETANKRIFYGGFNVPAVCIVWIAGEFASGFDWLRAAREDRDTIPAPLSVPDGAVARVPDRRYGELLLRCFQLLQAHDVGRCFGEPPQQDGEPAVDAVDIEGGDFHRVPLLHDKPWATMFELALSDSDETLRNPRSVCQGCHIIQDRRHHHLAQHWMIFSSDTTGAARIGFAAVGAKADLPIALKPASHGTSLVGAAKFKSADIGQLTQMLGMGRPPLEAGPPRHHNSQKNVFYVGTMQGCLIGGYCTRIVP